MQKIKITDTISSKHADFFQSVFEIVKLIPAGRVTSYGAIANCLGMKKSSRMVGWAMNASHSIPGIPAHRVVNRNGLLTGKAHFSGPDEMEARLKNEGIEVIDNQVVNFRVLFWDPLDALAIK
jgi:methylated-DNA-protein-cysteine methyltransferase related protein